MAGHVLIACDKFKGSLTADEVVQCIAAGVAKGAPGVEVKSTVVADGGDGTLAAARAAGFELHPVQVTGPTGLSVETAFATRREVAVVELADACGIVHAQRTGLDALGASSRGFGEAMVAAWEAGYRTLILGIGGSASTDGGMGMLAAWGARALDTSGRPVPDGGGSLDSVHTLDLTGLHPALAESTLVIASDVNNPLLGVQGTVQIFSAQKGATDDDQALLERGLERWADVCEASFSAQVRSLPGAGAAGGVGFALLAAGARMRPGIDVLMDMVGLPDLLHGARLVITGEGSLDEQTLLGKAPAGVAAAARQAGVPVVAVCGRSRLSTQQLHDAGFAHVYALTDYGHSTRDCMVRAAELLTQMSADVAQDHL